MGADDQPEPATPGQLASVTRLPSRGGGLPQVSLDMRTLHYNENKVLTGELSKPASGPGIDADAGTESSVIVEIHDGFLYCRGEQAALVQHGVTKAEWLPGMPGNGRFAHVVVLNDSQRQSHRIYIRVWGHSPLVFEVRLPISDATLQELEIWLTQHQRDIIAGSASDTDSVHGDGGDNVVYLPPRR